MCSHFVRINFMQLNKNGLIDPSLKGENYWMCYFFLFFFFSSSFKCKGDSRALTDAWRSGMVEVLVEHP